MCLYSFLHCGKGQVNILEDEMWFFIRLCGRHLWKGPCGKVPVVEDVCAKVLVCGRSLWEGICWELLAERRLWRGGGKAYVERRLWKGACGKAPLIVYCKSPKR